MQHHYARHFFSLEKMDVKYFPGTILKVKKDKSAVKIVRYNARSKTYATVPYVKKMEGTNWKKEDENKMAKTE